MKIVTIIKYEANDGVLFDTEQKCLEYEKFLEIPNKFDIIKNEINEFLSNKDNYDDFIKEDMNDDNFHYCNFIWFGEKQISLEILVNKHSSYQLDENFCIDQIKWYKFLEKYEQEYFTKVLVPNYYWEK